MNKWVMNHLLVVKSFLLSITLHLSILSLFIFTFPENPIPPRPWIIFLGSFLKNIDPLNSPYSQTAQLSEGMNIFFKNSLDKKSDEKELKNLSLSKPSYTSPTLLPTKISLKDEFIKEETKDKKLILNHPARIENPIIPYQPLKLNYP